MKGLSLLAAAVNDEPDISTWSWATVTATAPLRVKLDGESSALAVTPDSLVAGLAVNDRVWVQLVTNTNPARRHRRLVITGRAGGAFSLDSVYPVGAVYMSAVSTSPATLFGGTWAQIQDRFLLAAGSTFAAGATGGEINHTLTIAEIPAHTHPVTAIANGGSSWLTPSTGSNGWQPAPDTGSTGGGGAHNNMPPYVVVYVWKRTA